MESPQLLRLKTISQYHQLMGLPKPEHPLISVVNLNAITEFPFEKSISLVFDFYSIALKTCSNVKYKYGQQDSDFNEGTLFFMSPGQVIKIEVDKTEEAKVSGWLLYIHPDFIWNTALAKTIKQYEFFNYSVHEALHLSNKEETIITSILQIIKQEYHSNIDKFTQGIIITQLESLLNFSDRFYNRQFITRKISNHNILNHFEEILTEYFNTDSLQEKGLPTVKFIAEALNTSTNYLSGVLKTLTGKNAQQHIHDKLIDKAKEKLSTTSFSISEIAYQLGFEHSPSFSKLFKAKTNVSPLEFRQSFN
ncbi:MAG: AraC family transcriptional regulator [Mucilaginibacter sp.]|uniref:AraC family transcriptional regulator n=1 Tax=Mucilaginibacter sp. TaxID=1882438 RepID=UPI0034E4D7AD